MKDNLFNFGGLIAEDESGWSEVRIPNREIPYENDW